MSRPCPCMTTSIVKDDKKTKAVIKQGEAQTCVSLKSVNGVKYRITRERKGEGAGGKLPQTEISHVKEYNNRDRITKCQLRLSRA